MRYVREKDIEFFFADNEFQLLCFPYSLHLFFDQRIFEDGTEKASFDVEKGILTVRLPKETRGEVFTNLDSVTKLVRGNVAVQLEPEKDDSGTSVYYGFNNHYTGLFKGLEDFEEEIIENPYPERILPEERTSLRHLAEESKFDGQHYLGDLVHESEDIESLLHYEPWWQPYVPRKVQEQDNNNNNNNANLPELFSEQDRMVLMRLSPKMFLLENEDSIWIGLTDLLFAHCYDYVHTLGQCPTCESSWTLSRLSRLLSWLDVPSHPMSLHESMRVSYRRCLAYPLYRNYRLCCCVKKHVANVLRAGKSVVMKSLLNVYHAMTHNSEKRYLLNVAFLNDYLIWTQMRPDASFSIWADAVEKCTITKSDTGFPLLDLEASIDNREHVVDE